MDRHTGRRADGQRADGQTACVVVAVVPIGGDHAVQYFKLADHSLLTFSLIHSFAHSFIHRFTHDHFHSQHVLRIIHHT